MAFEILQPDVGSRLMKTFGTISEENRKRQELASNIANRENQVLQRTLMNDIRERALGISQQRADQGLMLGLGNLNLRKQVEERMARQAGVRMLLDQQKLDATEADEAAQAELAQLMNVKDESGLSLSQRLHHSDEKIAREAMTAFAELSSRYAGKGKATDTYLKYTSDLLSKDRQAVLAAEREKRMAQSAEDANARFERAQTERERAAKVREEGKSGAAKISDADRSAVQNFNRDIASAETQYRNFEKQRNATKNPAEKEKFLKQMADMGNLAKELRDKRDALVKKYQTGPNPGQLIGGDLPLPEPDLPPVPENAAAPALKNPIQPSIQAVPAPVVPQSAPAPVSPVMPLQNQAPMPTQADVNGLDFIFARPKR